MIKRTPKLRTLGVFGDAQTQELIMKPFIPLTLAALMLSGTTLFACGKNPSCPMNSNGGMQKMRSMPGNMHPQPLSRALEQMDLTEVQQQKLDALQSAFREQMMSQRGNRGNKGALISNAISEKGFDTAAFMAATKTRSEARDAMQASHLQQIVDVLTPEQRLELKKTLESMPQAGQKRRLNLGY